MAWKRGTQNNQAGAIRMGHVREFLAPSSKDGGVTAKLKILRMDEYENLFSIFETSAVALVCSLDNDLPSCFTPFINNNMVYLHSHNHPRCVLAAMLHKDVPRGSIILSDVQCINSKVCVGENQEWTVYQGEQFTYDAREGVIGNTAVRQTGDIAKVLESLVLEVRCQHSVPLSFEVQTKHLTAQISNTLVGCIVTVEELFLFSLPPSSTVSNTSTTVFNSEPAEDSTPLMSQLLVGRVTEVAPYTEEEDEDEDFQIPDHFRGMIDETTRIFITLAPTAAASLSLTVDAADASASVSTSPDTHKLSSIVHILTNDDEVFPVKRRLLRSCLSLTSQVQADRGIYKNQHTLSQVDNKPPLIAIAVSACTFDRVILFLEHEARNEPFLFDPLIAAELLTAAISLKVQGLQDACEKSLGSFEERVRKSWISLDEVVQRNMAGDVSGDASGIRSETLLILDGMVLDVSRWLAEHPGGSTIIPQQSLNIDCAVFFEIYHASSQSFLYLKEFYIGELSLEDRARLERDTRDRMQERFEDRATVSQPFLEQIRRITCGWRLQPCDIADNVKCFKSF